MLISVSLLHSQKKRIISNYAYKICNEQLESVNSIRDLGITLDSKLHLDLHIDNIIGKAFKMYGFVMRSSAKFTRPSTYLHLYKSLIRSQLDYAVSIWNPFYGKYTTALERVQKKFLRCMHYKCYHSRLSYDQLLVKYELLKLESRRIQLGTMLIYDLCHNRYDCMPLINKLCYRVPNRTHCRNPCQLFALTRCRTNAGKRSPLYRLVKLYNTNFNSIDISVTRPSIFKNKILEILE